MTNQKASSLYTALAAAQGEMTKALKDSNNPHFKSKYADLASVMDACMPALSKHGIAVLQPPYDDETGRYVKTIFIHGESGETTECRIPLIIGKNDMQGYGSAVTYARRYGLMSMAGIAPEDDDGNAAAAAAPKQASSAEMKRSLDQISNDLNDVETEPQLVKLWRDVQRQMADEGWPPQIGEGSFRKQAQDMFAAKKAEILAASHSEENGGDNE